MTACLKKNSRAPHSHEFLELCQTCKNLLTNTSILQYSDFQKPFVPTTNAIGAILSKGEIPHNRPVVYAFRTLSESKGAIPQSKRNV